MAKAFASQGDATVKQASFTEIGEGLWAFTVEGDPNPVSSSATTA
jgi:hypothetical protein